MRKTYALHHISDPNDPGFSPEAYSLFKHGDASVGRRFGKTLAQKFIEAHCTVLLENDQIVVLPSPYAHIPTAVQTMLEGFTSVLNMWLVEQNRAVTEVSKIWRSVTYRVDYGLMNKEERMQLIQGDQFYVDKNFLAGKLLIFLDDIKITGSHEFVITKMLHELDIQNDYFLLYFAELANPDVHPRIENHLNQYTVKTVDDLEPIIASGQFKFNTRVVKFILGTELSLAVTFLERRTPEFLEELYHLAIGNQYHVFPEYTECLSYLRDSLIGDLLTRDS
jgi:PRTase ComF-like